MLFDNFLGNGYLEPMQASEIANLTDFIDHAIKGVQHNGKFYAIPQLGCANILFYKKSDIALAKASSINELKSVLS